MGNGDPDFFWGPAIHCMLKGDCCLGLMTCQPLWAILYFPCKGRKEICFRVDSRLDEREREKNIWGKSRLKLKKRKISKHVLSASTAGCYPITVAERLENVKVHFMFQIRQKQLWSLNQHLSQIIGRTSHWSQRKIMG